MCGSGDKKLEFFLPTARMIQIILIKAKWNAFVRRRMSCGIDEEVTETEDSELSSNFSEQSSEYLIQ